ncbi:MAG: fatty acid desaturase [Alphaproteobacteria bacterium]|jgi:fatty acid desaturase|nr:fatty acid desaturase [Rhodospirillaceae bacterium]MBT6203241.1 fatty acid desaturase [Rhodospirillaceae bacterium]MBT6512031.1 fatty acid desaturase [Rhodospirillaceae bacterium]MBT7646181.1 fatty acid desaturase [Rhodospirillaceae bacterium]MDG2480104.1 fatty acid desaturase [Alphaproteobacteria bacterium]
MSAVSNEIDYPALWRRWEFPTWGVIVVIYGLWIALTLGHATLPFWFIIPAGALLLCWHGHLQHEVLHGHPTRIRWFNELLVFPALGMWFPYGVYRDSHLAHHADCHLTCPIDDPESYYVTPGQWSRMGAFRKMLLRFNNTVLGRLLIGPALATWPLYGGAVIKLASGNRRDLKSWILHIMGGALVIAWLVGVAGFPLWVYAICVYFGVSLIMLRSYAEHRPAIEVGHRICVNIAEAPIALLFLNNNLHAVHHSIPGMAWYALPAIFKANRETFLADNGGFLWNGYRDVFRRHFLTPKDEPVHPLYEEMATAKTLGVVVPAA